MKERVDLAFGTDGDLAQILGIACIIDSFFSRTEVKKLCRTVWILAPKIQVMETLNPFLSTFQEIDFKFLAIDSSDSDRYYLQIGLTKLFDALDDQRFLLALDYDHVIFNPVRFFAELTRCQVTVSSEVYHDLTRALCAMDGCTQLSNEIDLPEKHLNTSLISGKVADLKKIGRYWGDAYNELFGFVSDRYRVEIAFSLAAERASVMVKPCEVQLQGNFALPTQDCSVFHFGGESDTSKFMKNKLLFHAQQILKKNRITDDIALVRKTFEDALCGIIKK
jgi:hypothetical protein